MRRNCQKQHRGLISNEIQTFSPKLFDVFHPARYHSASFQSQNVNPLPNIAFLSTQRKRLARSFQLLHLRLIRVDNQHRYFWKLMSGFFLSRCQSTLCYL